MISKVKKIFHGLQVRLIIILGGILVAIFLISGIVIANYSNDAFSENEATILQKTNQNTSLQIKNYIDTYSTMMKQLAVDPTLKKTMLELKIGQNVKQSEYFDESLNLIKNSAKLDSKNILAIYYGDEDSKQLLDSNGVITSDDPTYDVTSRDWYIGAKDNYFFITEPYEDVDSGEQVISISVSVKDEEGNFLGVVSIDILITVVSDMVANTTLGNTGYYTMVTNEGIILSHKDKSLLLKNINDIGLDKNILTNLNNNKNDITYFKFRNQENVGSIIDIPGINWKLVGSLPASEFNANTTNALNKIILICIVSLIVMLLALVLVARMITKPIRKLIIATNKMAQGDLDVEIDVNSNGEIGTLSKNLSTLVNRLKENIQYINEVSGALKDLSNGNLSIKLKQRYDGEFVTLKNSLMSLSVTFTNVMNEIITISNEVANGANQINEASQILALGVENETILTDNISITIEKVSKDLSTLSLDSREVNKFFTKVNSEVISCNNSMNQMLGSMEEIQVTSSEIKKVIKVIEDIAFQTNILALNAAVEAARAGASGKGFAVVADEVRNLAAKSSDAAKTTTELIGNSIEKVNHGKSLTDTIAKSLNSITGQSEKVGTLINSISTSISKEATSIESVAENMQQISEVVHNTSSTAQEIAAASEEFSSQAKVLTEITGKFNC
ncbi:methyl-accepting chemotaxis protein [Romboutsia sp.]|uniref:methyl-accepting chemotaxis protein n=1 Tax=Romboutsia sp. TaxID=1965302 RepID=UPI003F32430D